MKLAPKLVRILGFSEESESNKFLYLICIIYLVALSLFMLWHRMWFSPDQFLIAAVVAALILGKFGQFVKDWVPFVLLFLGYEALRGLAPILNKNVHITEMIQADKFIFGFLPTIRLQELLFYPGQPQWYDFVAIILYMSHFIMPMVTAFVFWLLDKKTFREFTWALIILSFAGFITYVLYPAMPPWLAANQGYLPPLEKIMDATIANLANPIALPTVYKLFRGDEVAAMPSLHAAYPILIALFFVRKFRLSALLTVPYVATVWFAVVYLGEHYVIDVIFGALYALIVFLLVTKKDYLLSKLRVLKNETRAETSKAQT
ncbi:MAG: phosphatase PAP2 family protein [bacterium]|nr:phosphatase PAP2 family protein [bacterium]